MFDLNEKQYDNVSSIFNGGNAGRVDGVTITVEKRKPEDPDTFPQFKLLVHDGTDANPLTQGFYDNDTDAKKQSMNIQRVKSIANAFVPEDFVFPSVNSYKEAISSLFGIINEHSKGKTANVFISFGYSGKPSKYLSLRFFNFIEAPGIKNSRLTKTPSDILERPAEDAPKADSAKQLDEDW